MKQNLKEALIEKFKVKSLLSPTNRVKRFSHKSNKVVWETPNISSKNDLFIYNNDKDVSCIFGYQSVIQGHIKYIKDHTGQSFEKYYGYVKVKLYPKLLSVKGQTYRFNYNPVKSVSTALKSDSVIEVPWKLGNFMIKVLNEEELIPEVIHQKSVCRVETYLSEEYLPEIVNLIDKANG